MKTISFFKKKNLTLEKIFLKSKFKKNFTINSVKPLHTAQSKDLTFFDSLRSAQYAQQLEQSDTQRTHFETGDVPTQVQFETFLESYVHLWDSNSGSIYIYGPGHITASGNISASGTGSFSYLHLSPIPTGSSNTVLILEKHTPIYSRL